MIAFCTCFALSFLAQEFDLYEEDAALINVGTVSHYRKSNLDGSHASRVSVYTEDERTLHSAKWTPGRAGITLVSAKMDWELFSVVEFESSRLGPGNNRQTVARLRYDPAKECLVIEAGSQKAETKVEHFPWHSYDFDFASLGATLPHRIDPEELLTFAIYDAGNGGLEFKGEVDLEYVGEESRGTRSCRKYRIDGEGLRQRGGHLWCDLEAGFLVAFEIDLPDEAGYTSNKLELLEIEPLSRESWDAQLKRWADGED